MKRLSSIATFPIRNKIRAGKLTFLLPIGLILILSALFFGVSTANQLEYALNQIPHSDMLAYVTDENDLMLYNPHTRTETTLLEDVSSFVLGQSGHIAFTKLDETDTNLYIFNSSTPTLAPVSISQNFATNPYPLAWSPDGRYLAFGTYKNTDDHSLHVWDGKAITNIMPNNRLDAAERFYLHWSHDGRLAFTVRYGWSDLDTPTEIYLWDGSTTINLSQNPERWDYFAGWSQNGQLMFLSNRGDEGGFYVWDGVSFRDGLPDSNAFRRLAPELNPDNVMWINNNLVGFTVSTGTGKKEVVLWDLKKEAIVKQFPVSSDKAQSWLAEGGQMILSSHYASGIPSVYLDVENTEGDILFSDHVGEFAWSSNGYLAYCGIEEGMSRVLSIWDGKETWVVARVSYKPAQWQYGRYRFSCNNG